MPFVKAEYDMQYAKENIRRFNLKLNRIHDADLIKRLESQPNFQAYLKELIRKDMESAPVPDPENT